MDEAAGDDLIRLENVSIVSENFEILRDVTLSIPGGRSTVIIGPSGCGKSTLLKVAAGISLPAAYQYVSFMKVERSAYLRIPINWLYCVFIIFSVACICRYCWLTYRAIKGAKPPETDPAQLPE